MKEIANYIYDTLVADVTLRTYTGWSASDPRLYDEFPPEDLTPPFITFNVSSAGAIIDSEYIQTTQYEDQTIDINCFGSSADNRDNMAERITTILKDRTFTTSSYRVLRVVKEYDDNIVEIHETTGRIDSFRKVMRFRASYILKKLQGEW